jgi:hypothetical protein
VHVNRRLVKGEPAMAGQSRTSRCGTVRNISR